MAVMRRTRTRVVPTEEDRAQAPESRALDAVRRRRNRAADESPAQPAAQVVESPNTDRPFGEIIHRAGAKIQPLREGDYLHVSDLLHKCIRQRALEERHNIQGSIRRLTIHDQLTFAMGDAVHDTLKERAAAGAPDKMWGKWSCKCKYLFHQEPCTYEEIDQEETCPHCLTKVDQYHEVSFHDDEYGIVGNPDVLLYLPRKDAFHVTELKSMSHKQWEELARPIPEHVFQVTFYWHLMQRKGYRLTDRCSISYWTKQWQFGAAQADKEFLIDPVASLSRIQPFIEDALAYKAARSGGDLPLRTFCAHENAKGAKSCAVADICFGG